jgi:4-amino-4-deoxy-L-arabinose transferase-like glycosyltransferase
MLYAGLITLGGPIAAKLLHWIDALLAAIAIIYFCRTHLRSTAIGLFAALIFGTLPVVGWLTSTGGTDLPASFFTVLVLHAALRWRVRHEFRWLALAAGLSGYLLGVKPFAVITLLLILVYAAVEIWSRGPRPWKWRALANRLIVPLALAGMIASLMAVPWFALSAWLTGNPVFPGLNRIFHSPYWGPAADQYVRNATVTEYGHHHTLVNLIRFPWDSVINPRQYLGIIGPVFLVVIPLLLLALLASRRPDRSLIGRLSAFAVLWVVLWYAAGNFVIRYISADFPVLAMLAAFAVAIPFWTGWSAALLRIPAVAVTLAMVALNSSLLVQFQPVSTMASIAGRAAISWDYLYNLQPEEDIAIPPIIRWFNANLSPAHDKIWIDTSVMSFYLYSRIEFFNGEHYDSPTALGQWGLRSPDAIDHLHAEHVTYVELRPSEVGEVMAAPVGSHLDEVYRDPSWGDVIFKVV